MAITLDLPHPFLGQATDHDIAAFNAVALVVAENVYARPILERCVPETFPQTVKEECDLWISTVGEPEYGAPYTQGMRDNFYAIMIAECGKVFCIEGYCE